MGLILTLVFTCLGDGAADPPGEDLFRAGDAFAARGEHSLAIRAWRDGYLKKLPEIRGLPFRYPVPVSILPRAQLRARLLELFAKEYPEEEVRADLLVGVELGFFSAQFDLRRTLLEMLTQEIAGFYDPETKELYVVEARQAPKRWWSGILGSSSDFDPAERKAVLAHEMAHALVDQHFDLFSLERSAEADEDASLALQALAEGDAMVAMLVATSPPHVARSIVEADEDYFAWYFRELAPVLMNLSGGKAFREAPLMLREMLVFPYTGGFAFCQRLIRGGHWDRADSAFRQPPLSTEQILHPEKYPLLSESGGDVPYRLEFAGEGPFAGAPSGGESWELVKENVLGEFAIEVMLRSRLGRSRSVQAAAGWDGDGYRLYRKRGFPEARCLVWVSTWDSAQDAAEFAAALEAYFQAVSGDSAESERPHTIIRTCGQDVTVARGALPEAFLEAALAWASSAQRFEKTFRMKRCETPVRFGEEGLERDF